ncbi:hypothetical protein PsAD2_03906 [Pseudovibrio axinellae]|uniref:DUF1989 domain-containing protein n=1 Tax=Pseudovibrio axinellae TaxID=989403 RepID=A0A165UNB6_9HYPH|nr:DUF1989 domain-containing protein [Pseudovibrio axinellae]KZL12600.1 hypothetical protein PsAD2_03906 [Pseudovibrio axinellae]SEP65000.1 hypothetical protein SAMN05421798_10174 [Pseudovibrio axinellae]
MTKIASQSITTGVPLPSDDRRSKNPIVCYEVSQLPAFDAKLYQQAKDTMQKVGEVVVPPRDGGYFEVPAGHFFRIVSVEGPQVGDLNLWNAHNLNERFFSGKTRQLHASHLTTGDRLWSNMPFLRPMATITQDTLDWYGWDEDGAGVHDVIGTRCDPYTNHMLKGVDYNHCCHSNLTRAFAKVKGLSLDGSEPHIHDVMNVFMCTGFTHDTHKYFMKASPVRPGDFIEFFAEIDILGALSTCPGGDCGSGHSDDIKPCYPLLVEIFKPAEGSLKHWSEAKRSGYNGQHKANTE